MVQVLRAAIIAGEMEPGQLYSAPSLARKFGVSATPVREAMIELTRAGLVSASPNKGFRVSFPSILQLRNILHVRLLLEVPTVAQVAQHGITTTEYDELRRAVDAGVHAAARNDFVGLIQADMEFHMTLLSLAGNAELVEIVRSLRSQSRLGRWRGPDGHSSLMETARQHAELLELVSNREVRRVRELMTRHIADLDSSMPTGEGVD
jgi:DNA-binding GntR family transcriptional regulator